MSSAPTSQIDESTVNTALTAVIDPASGKDIVSLGLVSKPVIRANAVAFAIEVPGNSADDVEAMEPVRRAAQKAVQDLPGVSEVTVVLTATRPDRPAPLETSAAGHKGPKQGQSDGLRVGGHPDPNMRAADMLVGVDNVIAVASGKGGVGKSTTAVNLALALKERGHSVGLLDADIYGPSLPRMMGISGQPQSPDGKKILPMEKFGLEVMSIGFMVDPETPMIWRGPMVMGALEQMMRDVQWGHSIGRQGLDYVIVDMPPGTGDVALSLSQRVNVSGAVIVSTPQDIALIDAVKAINMFRKVNVPILGMIENMSHFSCPHCGERSDIFATGGAAKEANRLACDFLGEIPLDITIRETSDQGNPVVASAPNGAQAAIYTSIASKIAAKLAN